MGVPGALALVTVVAAAVVAGALWRWRHAARRGAAAAHRARREAVRVRLAALAARIPGRASLVAEDLPPHPAAATVEAHLLKGEPRLALAAAEAAVAEAPRDAATHVILARALLACDALVPAEAEVRRARELGAEGPLLDHVDGRVEHLLWLRRVNAGQPEVQQQLVPPLVTPFDRFVLKLARQQRLSEAEAALWLAAQGAGGNQGARLDPDAVRLLIARHHEAGARSLELLLRAAERAPGTPELVYHAARRALQTGFVPEGRALFARLAPLMLASPDHAAFERDRADLDGKVDLPPEPVAPAPPTPPGARRSAALKILR